MAAPSKSLVRQAAAPAVPVDYRVELTHGSVAGLVSAGVAVAFLIFLSGLVIGVRMNLELAEAPETEAVEVEAVAAGEAATLPEGGVEAAPAVDATPAPSDSAAVDLTASAAPATGGEAAQ